MPPRLSHSTSPEFSELLTQYRQQFTSLAGHLNALLCLHDHSIFRIMLISDYGLIEQFNRLISRFEAAKAKYALTAQIAIHEHNAQQLEHTVEELARLQTKILHEHAALHSHVMSLWQPNEVMTSDDDDFSDDDFSDGYLSDDDFSNNDTDDSDIRQREHERDDPGMRR